MDITNLSNIPNIATQNKLDTYVQALNQNSTRSDELRQMNAKLQQQVHELSKLIEKPTNH